jgi:hypothetical protein
MCGLSLDFCTYPLKPLKALRETADSASVDSRVRLLKQMVAESLYVVDERAVADAILTRAQLRQAVAAPELRGGVRRRSPRVRSFRRSRAVRSFRLPRDRADAAHAR